MNEFFANIWHLIESLVWSDWTALIILIVFTILGFKRGLAKELINFGFLLFAIITAWLWYQPLAISGVITWLLLSHQSHMAVAFSVIFSGVLLLKTALYQLTNAASNIHNPCTLNKIFTHLVFFTTTLVLSWHYLDVIATLDFMNTLATNTSIRIALSFVITFALIVGVYTSIFNILNLSINTSKTCFLSSFFKKILDSLHFLDKRLNAKNINNQQNNAGGLIIGLIKGGLVMLIIVLIFQNIDTISQHHYWTETKGILKALQNTGLVIQSTLSDYLLFIKNN